MKLYCDGEDDTTSDDYFQLSSLFAQKFHSSTDQAPSAPTIRAFAVDFEGREFGISLGVTLGDGLPAGVVYSRRNIRRIRDYIRSQCDRRDVPVSPSLRSVQSSF